MPYKYVFHKFRQIFEPETFPTVQEYFIIKRETYLNYYLYQDRGEYKWVKSLNIWKQQ